MALFQINYPVLIEAKFNEFPMTSLLNKRPTMTMTMTTTEVNLNVDVSLCQLKGI